MIHTLCLSLSFLSLSPCTYRLLLDDLVLAPCDAVHEMYVIAACTKTCTFQIVCANVAASGPKPAMAIKGNIKAAEAVLIFNAVLSFGPAVSNPYASPQSMHPNMRDIICHHHHHHIERERDGFKKKRAFLMSHLFLMCKKKETYQRDRTIRLQKVRHHAFRPVVFHPVVVQSHTCFVVIVLFLASSSSSSSSSQKRERVHIIQLCSYNNSTKFAFTI